MYEWPGMRIMNDPPRIPSRSRLAQTAAARTHSRRPRGSHSTYGDGDRARSPSARARPTLARRSGFALTAQKYGVTAAAASTAVLGPHCIAFGSGWVDRRSSERLLEVISPLGMEASLQALQRLRGEEEVLDSGAAQVANSVLGVCPLALARAGCAVAATQAPEAVALRTAASARPESLAGRGGPLGPSAGPRAPSPR